MGEGRGRKVGWSLTQFEKAEKDVAGRIYDLKTLSYGSFATTWSQLKISDFSGERFKDFEVLYFSMSATTTQPLPSGKFCKLRYDTISVKRASANVYFYTNNSKMPNFDFWHSCLKWATCRAEQEAQRENEISVTNAEVVTLPIRHTGVQFAMRNVTGWRMKFPWIIFQNKFL
jgi:hypothetical protein